MYNVGEIKRNVYLPDCVVPAILRPLSIKHRVGDRPVCVGGLSVNELVLTRLRGAEILKKYAK